MAIHAATSPRLHLQTLDEETHLLGLHEIMRDPESMKWSTNPYSTNIEQTRAWLRANLPRKEKPWLERWAIMLRDVEDGEEAGKPKMIGVIGIVREQEIGYRINRAYWGKGYMSEALQMFVKMFFSLPLNEKYDRILAAADPANGASMRVLEKAGFQKGEYRKEVYERASLGGKKSDLQCYYLERPRSS